MQDQIANIFAQFNTGTQLKSFKTFGSGHINDTLLIESVGDTNPDFIIQRINHYIFKDVKGLMRNIELVTNFIRSYLETIPGTDPNKEVLTLVYTNSGKTFFQDAEGEYWRCYLMIPNTVSFDKVDSCEKALEGWTYLWKVSVYVGGTRSKIINRNDSIFS